MTPPTAGGVWHIPCCGWWGRIFGHSYREFPLKETPPADVPFEVTYISNDGLSIYIDKMTHREYALRCRRCGAL